MRFIKNEYAYADDSYASCRSSLAAFSIQYNIRFTGGDVLSRYKICPNLDFIILKHLMASSPYKVRKTNSHSLLSFGKKSRCLLGRSTKNASPGPSENSLPVILILPKPFKVNW